MRGPDAHEVSAYISLIHEGKEPLSRLHFALRGNQRAVLRKGKKGWHQPPPGIAALGPEVLRSDKPPVVEQAWVRVAREAGGPEGRVVLQQWLANTTAYGVQAGV